MTWLAGIRGHDAHDYERWYSLSNSDLLKNGGRGLLVQFGDSCSKILSAVYPDAVWLLWMFPKTPNKFWEDIANQLAYMAWLSKRIGREEGRPENWYSVSQADFTDNFGAGLLLRYRNSPQQLLMALYPDAKWRPWKFARTPGSYWTSMENQKNYMAWLGEELGLHDSNPERWYALTKEDLLRNDGGSLLSRYDDSYYKLISTLYPEIDWLPWMFVRAPNGFWEDRLNRARYLRWLGDRVKIKRMEDWYDVTRKDYEDNFGSALLTMYNNSPSRALAATFVDYDFEPWRFAKTPVDLGKDWSSLSRAVHHVETSLNFKSPEDWNRVTQEQLASTGISAMIRREGGLQAVLKKVYPDHSW